MKRALLVALLVLVSAVQWHSPAATAAGPDVPLDRTLMPNGPHPGLVGGFNGGIYAGLVRDAVPVAGGNMLVRTDSLIMRVIADGGADASYGPSGNPGVVVLPNPQINDFVVDHMGGAYVGNGIDVWRISPDGQLSAAPVVHGGSSSALFQSVSDIGVDAQDRLLVLGREGLDTPAHPPAIARYTAAGTLDPTFAAGSPVPGLRELSAGAAAIVRPDSSVVVLDQSTNLGSVVHVTADGDLDPTWNGGLGVTPFSAPYAGLEVDHLAVDSSNRVLMSGVIPATCGQTACTPWIGRISATGAFETTFHDRATSAISGLEGGGPMAVTTDGHVLVLEQRAPGKAAIVVLTSDGVPDAQYGWRGDGTAIHPIASDVSVSPTSIAIDGSGRLLVTAVNGGVARLLAPRADGLGGTDYVPVVPERLLDTRLPEQIGYSGPKPAAHSTVVLHATGVGATRVPTDATAVVLNLTGTDADADGYVSVWPCGTAPFVASNLNVVPGRSTPNLVVTGIGVDGTVCIYTNSSADLVADVAGYFPALSVYQPLVPTRLLDTRQVGVGLSKPGADSTTTVQIPDIGPSAVPSGAGAVVLNVTATDADAPGFVTVWPCDAARPTASNLNIVRGGTSANLVMSALGPSRNVCMFSQSSAHLIVDTVGFFPSGAPFHSVVPERLLDTRATSAVGYTGPRPTAGATVRLHVTDAGATKVPTGATAVVLNVTGTGATADGYVTVWPCGAPRPTASNLNLVSGGTSPNLVVSGVGTNGDVCLFTQSGADLIADVAGYWP